MQNEVVQCALVTLQNGEALVKLVGMSHLANKQFLEETTILLLNHTRCGFHVLYEDLEGIDEWLELECPLEFQSYAKIKCEALDILQTHGIWYQGRVMPKDPKWINADALDSLKNYLCQTAEKSEEGWSAVIEERKRRFEFVLLDPNEARLMLRYAFSKPRPLDLDDPITEHGIFYRDRHAVRCILQHAEKSPVISPWDVGHLRGIVDGLTGHGFRVVEIEWCTVLS